MDVAAFNVTSGPIQLARCDVLSSFASDDRWRERIDGGYKSPLCVNVVGPMLVGVVMNAFGLGMIVVLASAFFSRTTDVGGRRIKQMTLLILTLNIVNTAILVAGTTQTLAAHWGQMPYYILFHAQISNLTTPLFEALLILLCEIFLALRCLNFVRALAPERKVAIWALRFAFVVGITGAFSMRLGATAVMWRAESLLALLVDPTNKRTYATLKTGALCVNGFVDVLLSVTMSLECHRAKSNFKSSNQVLQSLITTMIGGGVLLVLIQLWAIILFFINSAAGWSIPPTYILGQAYSVTFFFSILRPRQAQAAATAASNSATHARHGQTTATGTGPGGLYLNPQGDGSAATLNGMMDDPPHTTKSNPEKGSGGLGSKGSTLEGKGHKRGRSASYKWRSTSGGFKRWSIATLTRSSEPHPPPLKAEEDEEGDPGEVMSMEEMFSSSGWGAGTESGRTTRRNSLGAASSVACGGMVIGPSPRGSVGGGGVWPSSTATTVQEEEGESRVVGSSAREERDVVQDLFLGYKGLG